MKRILTILGFISLLFFPSILFSQDTTRTNINQANNFVDLGGDGYNDNAPDHNGDGIPNGLDPDYNPKKHQQGKKKFIDLDGDGINDYILNEIQNQKRKMDKQKDEMKGKEQKGKWYFDESKFKGKKQIDNKKGKGNEN